MIVSWSKTKKKPFLDLAFLCVCGFCVCVCVCLFLVYKTCSYHKFDVKYSK